ncbi:hypothetical protein [Glycomyces xiaoerkulensis]|uniref:hypothetical protein n=1 Tax=Glycomyces xiaoerkulensis TaxID=2038139 RepID=UPI0012FFE841|nr:hypothetical protein [Glycomyces xiaoerkulensis]
MEPPSGTGPEPLYRKPGTVTAAQALNCLCTGSAMQWFKQGGWEPWRRYHYPPQPWY